MTAGDTARQRSGIMDHVELACQRERIRLTPFGMREHLARF
jgi:hypothetical protein